MYAGETIEITNTATDFAAAPITPTTLGGGGTVTIEIVDAAHTPVVTDLAMTWDPARNVWAYLWQSPPEAGAYTAKVTVTSDNGTTAYEYLQLLTTTSEF